MAANLPLQLTYEQSRILRRQVCDALERMVAHEVVRWAEAGADRAVIERELALACIRFGHRLCGPDGAKIEPEAAPCATEQASGQRTDSTGLVHSIEPETSVPIATGTDPGAGKNGVKP